MITIPNNFIHSDSSDAAKIASAFTLLVDVSRGFVNNLIAQFISVVLFVPIILPVFLVWTYINSRMSKHFKLTINDFEHGGKRYKVAMKDFMKFKNQDSKMVISYKTVNCPVGLLILVHPLLKTIRMTINYRNQLCVIVNDRNDVPKDDFFQHIDSQQLWQNRTQAYEYLM